MSFQITEAFRQQFADNFIHVAQQKTSLLERAVTMHGNIQGQSKRINRLGKRSAQLITTRHGDTPINDQPHSSRYLDLQDWIDGDMIDDLDVVRTLIDPKSDYVASMISALNREKDREIINALGRAARSGTSSTVSLATANREVTNAALTKTKLIAAREYFRNNDADEQNGEELYITLSSSALGDLLTDTTLTNSEYNSLLSLASGQVNPGGVFGFKPIFTNLLPACTTTSGPGGSGVYPANGTALYCFAKSAIAFGVGKDITVKVGEDSSKQFNTRVAAKMSIGAVRVEEEKVYEIFAA